MSLNAKGLNTPFKRSMLWKEAKTCKADIICVQETHFKRGSPMRLHHRSYPHVFFANTDKKRAGVLVAVRDSLTFQLIHSYADPGGRFIILICDINNIRCTLVNVYAPNKRQVFFLNRLRKRVGKLKQGMVLWCGDFNAIADVVMDSTCQNPRASVQPHSWLPLISMIFGDADMLQRKILRFILMYTKPTHG